MNSLKLQRFRRGVGYKFNIYLTQVFCLMVILGVLGIILFLSTEEFGFGIAIEEIEFFLAVIFFLFLGQFAIITLTYSLDRPDPIKDQRVIELYEKTMDQIGMWRFTRPILNVWDSKDMNAFAYGYGLIFNYICLSNSLIDQLDDQEVQAVILHELGHIRAKDNIYANLFAMIVGVSEKISNKAKGFGIAFIMVPFLIRVIQFVFATYCRQREYLADFYALECGYGFALISALRKISGKSFPDEITYFSEITFSSHPTLEMRIRSLEEFMI